MLRLLLFTLIFWSLIVYGFADASDDFLFTVQRDGQEAGSGFLIHERGKSWLVSNRHVVEGDAQVLFAGMLDSTRTFVLPERVQIASNRDAVRFRVDLPDGFSLGDDCSFDEEVFAFGNSDGKGVITKSAGKVVGKGRGEIEITCDIIPGNSGGPVINEDDEVVGLATDLIEPPSGHDPEGGQFLNNLNVIEGTRYEETRRFAVPLHDAKWQEVDLATFQSESMQAGELFELCDQFFNTLVRICLHYPLIEGNGEIQSPSWIRSYNRKLEKYGYYSRSSQRYIIRSGKQDSMDRALQNWLEDLSEKGEEMSESLREEAEDFVVKYYQMALLERADDLEDTARELLELAEDDQR